MVVAAPCARQREMVGNQKKVGTPKAHSRRRARYRALLERFNILIKDLSGKHDNNALVEALALIGK